MKKADVYSTFKNARISPKKVMPVLNLVRGKNAIDAKIILSFNRTKAGAMILKTLNAALANAKNNSNLNGEDLFVTDLQVNEGRKRKAGEFVGRGRFNPLLKRSSHIMVGLSSTKEEAKGKLSSTKGGLSSTKVSKVLTAKKGAKN